MRKYLTKETVDAIKPGSSDVYVWDTKLSGFGYKITARGYRSFVLSYQAPGFYRITRRIVIGEFGPMTVDQARKQAMAMKTAINQGTDPLMVKAEQRRTTRDETLGKLFAEYLDRKRKVFKPRTMTYYENLNKLYIQPALGPRPVASITKADLHDLHRTLSTTPVTANRVIRLVGMFYVWLERDLGYEGKNPAARFVGYPEQARERYLTVEEMGRLGEALRVAETVGLPPAPERAVEPKRKRVRNAGMFKSELQPANPVAVSALRFLVLTGWRKSEVLTLTWKEVNLTNGAVTLDDTKSGKSARTIGGAALALLATQPRVEGSPYVFPGRDPQKPLRELQRLWYAARHAAQLDDVRLHDLRHSVASVAGGHGYSLPLIGKLLGHKTVRSSERYVDHHTDASKVVADTVSGAIDAAMQGQTTPITPLRAVR